MNEQEAAVDIQRRSHRLQAALAFEQQYGGGLDVKPDLQVSTGRGALVAAHAPNDFRVTAVCSDIIKYGIRKARELQQRPTAVELADLLGERLHIKVQGVEITRCHLLSVRPSAIVGALDGTMNR